MLRHRLLAVILLGILTVAPPAAATESTTTRSPSAEEQLQWLHGTTTTTLSEVAQLVKSNAVTHTGQGVTVALIDTGVAPVPGLTQGVLHGPDLSLESQNPDAYQLDQYGHGTHLAGIITSDRSDAPGVARNARLLSLKVGAHNGAVDVSQVIAAIDWVVDHRAETNTRVLVLAYGTDGRQDPRLDPLSHAVERAWRAGITVVVSAGNGGVVPVTNPATNPYVITVAAADTGYTPSLNDDLLAEFSSRGDAVRRPDVSAPGAGIVSLAVPGGLLHGAFPEAQRDTGLFRGNGTSQAAAVVGGAVALLLEQRPNLTPDQVKALLRSTARAFTTDPSAGTGIIDVRKASQTSAPTTSQTWPASTGTGSLEGARGSHHLEVDGVVLQGEVDIHGQPWDGAAWVESGWDGEVWDGGVWNGTSWTGTSWAGTSWAGTSWAGTSWAGTSWATGTWNGTSWAGTSWAGEDWHGTSWAGTSWASIRWS